MKRIFFACFSYLLPLAMMVTGLLSVTANAAPKKASSGKKDSEKINQENWLNHPEIKEVRALYEQMNAEAKKWKEVKVTEQYCVVTVFFDPKAVARITREDCGSDDSVQQKEHYYAENGVLRFFFFKGGAVNDSSILLRVYFDKKGQQIWSINESKGVGYTWDDSYEASPETLLKLWKISKPK